MRRRLPRPRACPLGLRPVETFQFPLAGHKNENPFCALLARTNQSCSACLQMQQQIAETAKIEAQTLRCFAGLCETAVPVRVGENLIAFLQTGQVLLHQPTKREFKRMTRQLLDWGREIDLKRFEEAYFQTRVVSKNQYESIIRLLAIFAQHLAALSNQLMVREEKAESPMIARARSLHRRAPERGALAQGGGPGGQHERLLFLQDVQAGDRPDVHRLSRPRARGEGEEPAAQPAQARERGGV